MGAIRRTHWVLLVVLALVLSGAFNARVLASNARGVCVSGGHGCYSSLAAALAAAPAGATVTVGPGSFRGGVVITRSVAIVGAGEQRTTIRGGGPVLTVAGSPLLTVSLRGLRISGGAAHSNTLTNESFRALGGGLFIKPQTHGTGDPTVGARVTLRHVTVAGNVANPTTTSPSPSGVKCPVGDCPFAFAAGGGIASYGDLTLDHTTVSGNRAGPRASDADGGGVFSSIGDLTITSSLISGNRARATGIGRFAEGGGVFVSSGNLSVLHSRFVGNRADLHSRLPVKGQGVVIDMNANSGAIHVGDGSQVLVSHTQMAHNAISAVDPAGEPLAFDAAMLVGDSTLHMDHTSVDHNSVRADVATAADVGSSGTALELDGPGTVTDSRVVDNPVRTHSAKGESIATGGLAVYDFSKNPRQVTVRRVLVSHNVVRATSEHGSALVKGAGVVNNSLLDLHRVRVIDNVGIARAPSATAQGGGVWNGVDLSGPPVVLRVWDSRIAGNSLITSKGGKRAGGGLFTTAHVQRLRSTIEDNRPDDCSGCLR